MGTAGCALDTVPSARAQSCALEIEPASWSSQRTSCASCGHRAWHRLASTSAVKIRRLASSAWASLTCNSQRHAGSHTGDVGRGIARRCAKLLPMGPDIAQEGRWGRRIASPQVGQLLEGPSSQACLAADGWSSVQERTQISLGAPPSHVRRPPRSGSQRPRDSRCDGRDLAGARSCKLLGPSGKSLGPLGRVVCTGVRLSGPTNPPDRGRVGKQELVLDQLCRST